MDPDQNMLSEEVISYLSRVFLNKHRRLNEQYVIHIISDLPLNEEHVRNAIKKEGRSKRMICAMLSDD